jgi:hypothetical protein
MGTPPGGTQALVLDRAEPKAASLAVLISLL